MRSAAYSVSIGQDSSPLAGGGGEYAVNMQSECYNLLGK